MLCRLIGYTIQYKAQTKQQTASAIHRIISVFKTGKE